MNVADVDPRTIVIEPVQSKRFIKLQVEEFHERVGALPYLALKAEGFTTDSLRWITQFHPAEPA